MVSEKIASVRLYIDSLRGKVSEATWEKLDAAVRELRDAEDLVGLMEDIVVVDVADGCDQTVAMEWVPPGWAEGQAAKEDPKLQLVMPGPPPYRR